MWDVQIVATFRIVARFRGKNHLTSRAYGAANANPLPSAEIAQVFDFARDFVLQIL